MSATARARSAPKPRPAPRAAPRPAAPRAAAAPSPFSGWRRWRWVAVLVAAVLIGLPLAHAILGEVAALLGGTFLLGLLVGRWTAPHG